MSSDFVRYSSEIETFDGKLSEYMTRIIDFWEKKVRASPTTEGTGRAVRGAHAKTIGVARAEVEIIGRSSRVLRAGHLRQARPPRRVIGFSSARTTWARTLCSDPFSGFAIKIFDIPGTKLVE